MFFKVIIAISLICLGLVNGRENRNCDGVVSNNKCYRLIYTVAPERGFTLAQAHDICKHHGGKLAEVASEEQYDLFYSYVQDNWNTYLGGAWQWVNIRLASKYENNGIRLKNGNFWKPRKALWIPGFPQNKPGWTGIGFQVSMQLNHKNKGFFDIPIGTLRKPVPLCYFDLE